VTEVTWDQVRAWRARRNHLEERAPKRRMLAVVGDMCAVQAQVQSAAELSLWARVEDLKPGDVRDALWKRRTLARTWSIRGTLHLHRSTELPLYTAALSTNRRWLTGAWLRYVGLDADGFESLQKAIRAALTDRPMTREELSEKVGRRLGSTARERLASGWGTLLKPAAFRGALISGPPRGQNVTFVRPDRWLKEWKPVPPAEGMREVVRRYLRAFGPATAANFAAWWGDQPGPAKRVVAELEDELAEVDVEGTTALALRRDVRELSAIQPSMTVRLLPNFDAYVMGFRPRDRLYEKRFASRVSRTAGWISPVVLVGGWVAGAWEYERTGNGVEVRVEPFQRLAAGQRREIKAEAERLGEFLEAPVRTAFA
jgi:Winged helix DNA-binding domain